MATTGKSRRRWRQTSIGSFLVVAAIAVARAQGPAPSTMRGIPGTAPPPQFEQEFLDLFFTDARDHLGPGQPSAAISPLTAQRTASSTASIASAAAASAASTGEPAWSSIVSRDTLEGEVKSQLPVVQAAVKTPSAFTSGGFEDARQSFSVLAAAFGVIAEYDGDVRWKRDAASLRQAFGRAGLNAKTSSDAALSEAKQRAIDLESLVRGESLSLPPADAEIAWNEIVDRTPLMTRMEQAQRGRLDAWTATAGEFSKNRESVLHEAEMLSVLAHLITAEGFEYADDETFVTYAKQLRSLAAEVTDAARKNDHSKAESAVRLINKACDDCHGDYRG